MTDIIRKVVPLKEFEVTIPDAGSNLNFSGQPTPFHLKIDKGVITFWVYAETQEDATKKAKEYLNGITA